MGLLVPQPNTQLPLGGAVALMSRRGCRWVASLLSTEHTGQLWGGVRTGTVAFLAALRRLRAPKGEVGATGPL